MRVISTAKIITETKRLKRLYTIQSGNCKWVTVIETVKAYNFIILLLIIFKVIMH